MLLITIIGCVAYYLITFLGLACLSADYSLYDSFYLSATPLTMTFLKRGAMRKVPGEQGNMIMN